MIEDSVESFISQFKPYALELTLMPHVEGATLVECVVATKVLHFMERTNPYLSISGQQNVILNASSNALKPSLDTQKSFEVSALSQIKANGLVLERSARNVIVDVGVTLVVSLFDTDAEVTVGDWVSFESFAPMHGFVVYEPSQQIQYREEDSI